MEQRNLRFAMDTFDDDFTNWLLRKKSRHSNVQMNTLDAGVVRYTGFQSVDGSDLVEYCTSSLKRAVVTFNNDSLILNIFPAPTSVVIHDGAGLSSATIADLLKCPETIEAADMTKTQTLTVQSISSELLSRILKDSSVVQITLREKSRLKIVTITPQMACQIPNNFRRPSRGKHAGFRRTRTSALKLLKKKAREKRKRAKKKQSFAAMLGLES